MGKKKGGKNKKPDEATKPGASASDTRLLATPAAGPLTSRPATAPDFPTLAGPLTSRPATAPEPPTGAPPLDTIKLSGPPLASVWGKPKGPSLPVEGPIGDQPAHGPAQKVVPAKGGAWAQPNLVQPQPATAQPQPTMAQPQQMQSMPPAPASQSKKKGKGKQKQTQIQGAGQEVPIPHAQQPGYGPPVQQPGFRPPAQQPQQAKQAPGAGQEVPSPHAQQPGFGHPVQQPGFRPPAQQPQQAKQASGRPAQDIRTSPPVASPTRPPPGTSAPSSGQQTQLGQDSGSSSVSRTSSQMAKLNLGLAIPKRRNPNMVGTEGRKIVVETNYLALSLKKTNPYAYHYDCSFDPDKPKRLLRPALDEMKKVHYPDNHPAFDGRKNMYSGIRLPFGQFVTDTVNVYDVEGLRTKPYVVTINYVGQVDMSSLSNYMKGGRSTEAPQRAIQALDIVLRNPAANRFVQVGRSFFTPPTGQIINLGDGLELWYGFFQSAILGWRPFLNIDVAHKGFPKDQPIVDIICDQISCGYKDLNRELTPNERDNLLNYIRGLKVEYEIPNVPNSKKIYKVNGICQSSIKERFKLGEGENLITIGEYFQKEKNYKLYFPHMPCIHIGPPNRTMFVPAELCKIAKNQVIMKKMNEIQTANMVKQAAKPADERKRKIMDALSKVGFNTDKCIQEFGVTVAEKFERVEARILDPPSLEYLNNKDLRPRAGVWRVDKFLSSNNLENWVILNCDYRTRDDALWRFAETMTQMGKNMGINISSPKDVRTINMRQNASQNLEKFFVEVEKKSVQLIVVVIPDIGDTYAKVKQAAELTVGVLTQCVKSRTMFKMNPATASNILLKVNSKLNGVNHTIGASCRPAVLRRPVMIVGADVTHPSPDQTSIPSVAAVAASHDPKAFQYNMLWRLQPPRVEIIEDLQNIIQEQLMFFYRKTNGCKPEKIFVYRDGVSEGQFQQVLNSELSAIRRACSSMGQDFKPGITFLVVQKRHHTRFFPTNPKDEDGKNRNVPAGTIVDTQITHPTELDFYLVSHASIQGTSRPTKYHLLWDDNRMDENELEKLTYYLCHLFSRCTRAVSYPAPTYYAHLAAFRARVYLEGKRVQITNLGNEQRMREIKQSIVQKSPMFFV